MIDSLMGKEHEVTAVLPYRPGKSAGVHWVPRTWIGSKHRINSLRLSRKTRTLSRSLAWRWKQTRDSGAPVEVFFHCLETRRSKFQSARRYAVSPIPSSDYSASHLLSNCNRCGRVCLTRSIHKAGATIVAHGNTRKHLSMATRVEGWNYTFPPSPPDAIPAKVFD